MLLFGDFETTGLDPDKDPPLEFGLVLVNEMDHCRVLYDCRYLFRYPQAEVEAMRAACTFEAHERNGLWQQLLQEEDRGFRGGFVESLEFDAALCKVAVEQFKGQKPWLAGFNADFDRRYLRRYAPAFEAAFLDYHTFDVSTVRKTSQIKYPTDWGPSKTERHRGLEDCYDAIKYWLWYHDHVMTPYNKARG
jgi:oligoribonuclease (3'-5' exoribonuclease)